MKKILILAINLILISTFTSCVKTGNVKKTKVIVFIDDYKFENNLSEADFIYLLLPQTVNCKKKSINLQVESTIYKFSGNNVDTLKVVFKNGFFNSFFGAPINEEKAKNQLKEMSVPDNFLNRKFEKAETSIVNYLNKKNDDDIILSDKKYKILENVPNVYIVKNKEDYINALNNIYCKKNPSSIYVLYKLKSFKKNEKPITIIPPKTTDTITTTTPANPCHTTTIPSGLELKEKLREIIDTKKSTSERIALAEQVWNKYFDNDAYVAKLLHVGDKNSEIWDPGEGKEYFTSRLAVLKSIYDINIIRLEYSKEDPGKITGIHIIECHNASEKM